MISELEEKNRRVNELLDEYRQPHATDSPFEEAIRILVSMGWKPKRRQKKPVTAITDIQINFTR